MCTVMLLEGVVGQAGNTQETCSRYPATVELIICGFHINRNSSRLIHITGTLFFISNCEYIIAACQLHTQMMCCASFFITISFLQDCHLAHVKRVAHFRSCLASFPVVFFIKAV